MRASGSNSKLKVFCILLLLSGHEAVRIHDEVNLTTATFNAQIEPKTVWEKAYQDMNKQCSWSMMERKCQGEGCSWKKYPNDFPMSSCRKSDEYLLRDPKTVQQHVQMFEGIMMAKSETYLKKCQGGFQWIHNNDPRCKRRMHYIVNAVRFIALAKEKSGLSDEDRMEVQKAFTVTAQNIAKSLGQEGLLEQLQEKVVESKAMETNPEATTQHMVEVVTKITTGSQEDKAEAKELLKNFGKDLTSEEPEQPEQPEPDLFSDSEEMSEPSSESSDAEFYDEIAKELVKLDAEMAELEDESDEGPEGPQGIKGPEGPKESASLLQETTRLDLNLMGGLLLAVLAVGVTVFTLTVLSNAVAIGLLVYALVSVVTCGAYHGGEYKGAKKLLEKQALELKEKSEEETKKTSEETKTKEVTLSKWTHVKAFGKCVGKLLILPFKLVWYLGKWMYRGIKKLSAPSNKTSAPSM